MSREDCIIDVDVDGALCDVSSIRHFAKQRLKDFHAFHTSSATCPPHDFVLDDLPSPPTVNTRARG